MFHTYLKALSLLLLLLQLLLLLLLLLLLYLFIIIITITRSKKNAQLLTEIARKKYQSLFFSLHQIMQENVHRLVSHDCGHSLQHLNIFKVRVNCLKLLCSQKINKVKWICWHVHLINCVITGSNILCCFTIITIFLFNLIVFVTHVMYFEFDTKEN